MCIEAIGRKVVAALAFAVLALTAAGCVRQHGCEETTCDEWCEGMGEPSDDDLVFQTCVANSSSTGGDFILLDEAGDEVYTCEIEYDELGQEVGTCSYDFTEAKFAYCGCGTTITSYSY